MSEQIVIRPGPDGRPRLVDTGGVTSLAAGLSDPESVVYSSYEFGNRPGAAKEARDKYDAEAKRWVSGAAQKAPEMDLKKEQAARAKQAIALNEYTYLTRGGGQSLAAMRGGEQAAALQNQIAARANAGPPTNIAAATRAAMLGGSASANQLASNVGQERAKEIMDARRAMGGIAGDMRTGDQDIAIKKAEIELAQRELNDKLYGTYRDASQKVGQIQHDAQMQKGNAFKDLYNIGVKTAAAEKAREEGEENAWVDRATTAGSMILGSIVARSDRNLKDNIADGSSNVRKTFDSLNATDFKYKSDSGERQEPRTGVIAQDLAKTKSGRAVLVETPKGLGIDVPQGLGLALAGIADMNKRLKKLEK